MARVSIRYQNDTTVEANNLGDALVHLTHQGLDYVADVVEQDGLATKLCERCDGSGVDPKQPDPKVVLTRKQVEDMVAQVDAEAPRAPDNFEERVKIARRVAKA